MVTHFRNCLLLEVCAIAQQPVAGFSLKRHTLSLRVITHDLWWGQVSPTNSVFSCQLQFQQCLCPPTIRRCYNKLRTLS